VRHPYAASAEALWRADRLYDVLVVLGYNSCPRVRGQGSAIFVHLTKPGYAATEGCIALRREHLLLLLRHLRAGSKVRVLP
jgi:L,D-peptidoglycan transpeptidase YkuD (ErfK/YbiS/YcfS/YnhG family)